MKKRLKDEGNETVTNCNALKMQVLDGKMRLTDIADTQQLFRIIQSIPLPKAEPLCLSDHKQSATVLTRVKSQCTSYYIGNFRTL